MVDLLISMQCLVSKKSFNPNFVQFCGNVFRLFPLLPFYWKTRDNQAIEVSRKKEEEEGDDENTKSVGAAAGAGEMGKKRCRRRRRRSRRRSRRRRRWRVPEKVENVKEV